MTTKKIYNNLNFDDFESRYQNINPENEEEKNEFLKSFLNNTQEQNKKNVTVEPSEPTKPTEPSKPAQQTTEPETIVARRNSQKQRKASLEDYKNKFLNPPKITDRKTVYLSADTRDRLDEIVRRLGERGTSVSGFIENMAKEHLENFQDEIELWKKL